ncbi:MAG: response regulator [Candidatus Riflebacteria bacterium]|nr:response regulator [Candidatus Riflebacteria bacterium]
MARRILIADDSPTVRALLQESLLEEGYEIDATCDGVEALEHLYLNIPDLVLLDVEMPRMNGYQVLRLVREDPLVRQLPVIILTSKGEKSDRFWGLTVGADAYLVKDSDSWMLLGKIRELLDSPRASTPLAAQGGAAPPSPEALLERLNYLLDRKLFQATLSNELTALARNPLSLREVANLLFQLLGKVSDFHLAHVLLASGELMTCKAGAIGLDFASQADAKFRVACEAYGLHFVFRERFDFELADVSMRTRGIPRSLSSAAELELRNRDGRMGLLFLASGRENAFSEHVQETLEVFGTGASMAMDAALRARELDRVRHGSEQAAANLQTANRDLAAVRGELALYSRLTAALLQARGGQKPDLPDLPENCSPDLHELASVIRNSLAH